MTDRTVPTAQPISRLAAMLRAPDATLTWSDDRLVAAMVAFEVALARASSATGLIPADVGERIARAAADFPCDAPETIAAIGDGGRAGGTLAIPFVKRLTAHVAERDADAALWVHRGATSQDVVDTATVLVARDVDRALRASLARTGDALARLADAHRATVMCGRTLLQPAVPVSFGWKAAGWLAGIARALDALEARERDGWPLQLGGAAGTQAALDGHGRAIAAAMAVELGLVAPAIAWHGLRDPLARLACDWAIAGGVLGKIGRDVSLMMQPEVGEAAEPSAAGRGGSSAMPHKVNPVGSMLALDAALRLPQLAATLLAQLPAEHERGLGHWQSTAFVLADAAHAVGSAAHAVETLATGLRIDPARMAANLAATRGFVFAERLALRLGERIGKAAAHARVEALCKAAAATGEPLAAAVARAAGDDATLAGLAGEGPDGAFDATAELRDATASIDAVLAAWAARPCATTAQAGAAD